MFVIMNNKDEFYAIDYSSGGYAYFTNFLAHAYFFKTFDDAKKRLESEDFTKNCRTQDGVIFPPRLIQDCANVNYEKQSNVCTIRIVAVKFDTIFEKNYVAEIKKPKGYIYE